MKINDYIVKYRNVDEKDYRGTPLEEHYQDGIRRFVRTPYVICEDGFEMSVQASESHYSTPKAFSDEYTEVEIGYPSAPESLIAEYAEDWEVEGDDDPRLCQTVYGYVPVHIVNLVIEKHGGIDFDAVIERIEGQDR